MPADHGRGYLTGPERRLLTKILRGEVVAASALQEPDDPPEAAHADDGPQPASSGLQDRLKAGEALLRTLELIPPASAEPAQDEKRAGLILIRSPNARRVVLVFNGNTVFFAVPRSLVVDQDSHIVLLRDPTRSFGFLGIPDLGADYESCLANLQRIVTALGVDEVYCIGMSAGGSTAIRFGCDLKVRGIMGFSVPTTLDLNDDPGAELKHYPQLARLYKHARHFGIDLGKYYNSCSPRPGLMLVYGDGHPRDSWLAERMKGMCGVQLVPTEGFSGHKTFGWLQENGGLEAMVLRMFALEPVECVTSPAGFAGDGTPAAASSSGSARAMA